MRISDAVSNAANLAVLRQILEHGKTDDNPQPASCRLSFWCQERVSVPGYTGSVHLWVIIDKVLNMVKNAPLGAYEFPEEERDDGKAIAELIGKLDNATKDQYAKACVITRIFWCITWAIPSLYYVIRYNQVDHDWFQNYECYMFDYYTKNQYVAKFKQQPPDLIGCTSPNRWIAPKIK